MFPVHLYSDGPSRSVVMKEAADFLSDLGLSVRFRGDFLGCLSLGPEEKAELGSLLARARVFDIERPLDFSAPHVPPEPFPRELYDGFWVQRIFSKFFLAKNPGALTENGFHAVVTGRLLGTWGLRRYHARVTISGFPSFVSTSGVVEGPARAREYYFLKAEFLRTGKDLAELDAMFRGQFVGYEDERMTAITAAYVLQPLIHNFSGKEFCENRGCAVFNSHLQKEVLDIQHRGLLCGECRGQIAEMAKK